MLEQLPYLSTESSIEDRIVYLLKEKDRKAIALILNQYGSLLLNVIKRVVRDQMISEEVLQKVLLKIWMNEDAYCDDRVSLFTWLVSIARNAAIDQRRTKDFRLSRESEKSAELLSIGDKPAQHDLVEQLYVRQLLNQLTDTQKKLIDLSYFAGYSHKEIGEKLDMPLSTVKTRIRLAIKHLRSIV